MANADHIIDLLHEAQARPAGGERERFVDEACGDDDALREQVVSLLEAGDREGGSDFLKLTRILRPEFPPTEKPGDRIGRYKLLEQIGEGGCGVVYMAEQEEPVRRRVALKVIKLGMDTKQVIARFEAERQALAMMEHPNIAKVHDGGATDAGRPFFVMELVRGIRITDYCDQNNLSTDERLELFIQVCHAIQHAHQKGIIHRDIKPSNILVTQHDDVAVPKVIDFGIAKATSGSLTEKTVFTAFAQFIGTPAYMSPEQAQMSRLDVDTRADIYSLGVLLYELLTGHTPFDAKELLASGMDEMRRKIREEEPAKPSTCLSAMRAKDLTTVAQRRHVEPPRLIHQIRGDLDWLVMKCLEKDRTRRYETANGLAADVQHYLRDEPVAARPPSAAYRFQKLVRRNKPAFAAGAVVLLALLGGIAVSTWQALRATRAERAQIKLREEADAGRKTARIEAARSEQVAQFLQDILRGVGPGVARGRDTELLRELMDRTSERVGKELAREPEVEAKLRNTIGQVYTALGKAEKAVPMHRQAVDIQRKCLGDANLDLAESLNYLANAVGGSEGEGLLREALAMQQKLSGAESSAVADTLGNLGRNLYLQGKVNDAETLKLETLSMNRRLFGEESLEVSVSLNNLAYVVSDLGRLKEAENLSRKSLEIRRRLQKGDEEMEDAMTHINLGHVLERQGRLKEATSEHRQALAIRRKLAGHNHPDVIRSVGAVARLLWKQSNLAEAETAFRELVQLQRKDLGNEHEKVAEALSWLAGVLADSDRLPEAEAAHREAMVIRRKLLGREHPDVADSLSQLTIVLRGQGKLPEIESLLREELADARGPDPVAPSPVSSRVGVALHHLADVLRERWTLEVRPLNEARAPRENRALKEARALAEEACALYERHPHWEAGEREHASQVLTAVLSDLGEVNELRARLPADDPRLANSLALLTTDLLDQKKFAEAEHPARECLLIREKNFPDHWRTFNTRGLLGASLLGQQKFAEAEPLLLSGYEGLQQREEKVPIVSKGNIRHYLERLVQLYEATGQPEKVAEWKKKLSEFDEAEAGKEAASPKP